MFPWTPDIPRYVHAPRGGLRSSVALTHFVWRECELMPYLARWTAILAIFAISSTGPLCRLITYYGMLSTSQRVLRPQR